MFAPCENVASSGRNTWREVQMLYITVKLRGLPFDSQAHTVTPRISMRTIPSTQTSGRPGHIFGVRLSNTSMFTPTVCKLVPLHKYLDVSLFPFYVWAPRSYYCRCGGPVLINVLFGSTFTLRIFGGDLGIFAASIFFFRDNLLFWSHLFVSSIAEKTWLSFLVRIRMKVQFRNFCEISHVYKFCLNFLWWCVLVDSSLRAGLDLV